MRKIILLTLLLCEIMMMGNVYSENITDEISESLLRMHILANSDNTCDQEIKIKVRDYVIEYINDKNMKSKSDVIKSISDMKSDIDNLLKENGFRYKSEILISNSEFDTRYYSNISIPAGNYQALKIVLGEGNGKNWWCVAYPPLCFTESVTGEISSNGDKLLCESLNNEAYNIIKNKNVEYRIKFKSIELINSFFKNN